MLMAEEQLRKLREKIVKCWGKDTSYTHSEGSRGQCYVTALLVYKCCQGEIRHGYIEFNGKREHHFWNMTFDYFEVDFTSDQYGGDGFKPIINGETYYKVPNFTNPRFLKLLERFLDLNKQTN